MKHNAVLLPKDKMSFKYITYGDAISLLFLNYNVISSDVIVNRYIGSIRYLHGLFTYTVIHLIVICIIQRDSR